MFNFLRPQPAGEVMSAAEAHEAASKGDIILVDIRTPGEWMKSGIPEGAHAISVADPNFIARLEQLAGGDKSKRIAFICATGARTAQVVRALKGYGWENLIDVSEGLMGNFSAPGWIRSGLPMEPWNG